MEVNSDRLNAFMGKMITEVGAAMNASLVLLGDKLGLYRALAAKGPMSSAELASATGTNERYVREWLASQAASGYVEYDSTSGKFSMLPEQAMALADDDSPVFLGAVGNVIAAAFLDEPKITDAFKSGKGVGWNRRSECLFCGTARFFRTGYMHHLVQEWLPALEGVVDKLKRGAKVADVGCGHGVSTRLMAEAFPNSRFYGFDYHEGSIAAARKAATEAKLGDRVSFAVHSAKTYPAEGYDLVCFFDCLHDMGDPVGAISHVRETMAKDGTCMLVEPFAGDRLEDNLNPVGRVYYAASTMICTPASLDQEVGLALGAQAGEARLRKVASEGGLSRFRRAAETPFNLILEARI
ncbi:class I SAM-dependent methyltransferase [Bradyrhizobium japonicum]|uniref:class I SAM-dependent methyltransferase n=1 Tax=Bradyrhizobium japonicum TaxID=375 RepID=UPI001BAAA1E7|nr:methyltransferase domain-containing protein [Bradyrhizobium japonicum]MBR0911737.1 methyltransferase domain-containing protein [Bradyrhizobium japonicum]MCP1758880.1 SAM-dependent methyltransferase [Bradyrhizobium japonicum]MCP1790388.1 SAM-dependent methyltransferase [Bradyrhizobium japonicum]MCP1802885.1 SAM-dependent methyltransferase [Bradyrhizobium japonicum]MCP1811823.1 SAM-dependent methyltransferase [Bradyrhizobium japonicum]